MTYDLFYFKIGVFFGRIVIEKCLEVVDEVVLIIWNLKIGHYYVVRSIRPVVFCLVVNAVSFA